VAYDAQIQIRQGSNRPVYGQIFAPSGGTVTIQSGGTFTLLDETGAIVTGFNAVPVSGWTPGAQTSPLIWYILNASTLNPDNLESCVYFGVFIFEGIGSDGIARNPFVVDIQIQVLALVEVLATYNENQLSGYPNSLIYQVRLYITDVDMTNPTFTDGEINFFVQSNNSNVLLAAAVALETTATNAAYLANTVKIGSFGSGADEVYDALMERAKRFRAIAIVVPTVNSPQEIFVPYQNWECPGTMHPW